MLSAANFIDRFTNLWHHTKMVEDHLGSWAVFLNTFLVSWIYVDAYAFYLIGLSPVLWQFLSETIPSRGIFAFYSIQHSLGFKVYENTQIVVFLSSAEFITANYAYIAEVGLLVSLVSIGL